MDGPFSLPEKLGQPRVPDDPALDEMRDQCFRFTHPPKFVIDYELPLVRQHPRGRLLAALQRGRLPGQPALGPPSRRLAWRPVSEPVLPARLADPTEQHLGLPEGGLVAQRPIHERRTLFPSQPGPRRLAAPLHRRRHRRRRHPDERLRVLGNGADAAADFLLHGRHIQRLGVYRKR